MKSAPSGPKESLLFGHARAFTRDPLRFFADCSRSGDWTPLRFGPKRAFAATHPDLIEAVLVAKHRSFRKSPGLRRSSILFGEGLLTSEGDFWRRQRRLIQPAFHRDRIAASASTMIEAADHHLECDWRAGEEFDVHSALMGLTMDIAVRTLFGARVREMETVAEALDIGQKAFARWMHYLVMLPDWVPTPRAPGIARVLRDLDRVVFALIAERRASGEHGDDLLSMLLSLKDADDGEVMTRRQLRDEIMTLFLAGHETTALSLTWALTLLAQHPQAEAGLHAELDNVLGGRAVAPGDAQMLPYTEQVIREAMRLYPPAWIVGRQAVEPVEIGGHRVPAGASILMPQYVVHRDGRFFPDPEEFRPERWTPEFTRSLPRFAYFPFGGGPRICIGSAFAMLESVLLLASIASRYRLSLSPSRPVVLQPAFTLRPASGLWMTAKPR
jgi:cytochrome P450